MEVFNLNTESRLLQPIHFAGLQLTNRIVMPPMANNWANPAGEVTDKILEHYVRHAAGVGLLIVEHSYITEIGRVHPTQLAINQDGTLSGLTRLAAAIRAAGPVSAIQITHAGGRTTPEAAGAVPEAPSAVAPPRGTVTPRELTVDDLARLKGLYAAAARRARQAGFDAVELHGAHGYLLNQFYSPLTNHRTDSYGGSRPARLRFPLEVVDEVRRAVGPRYPVFYRLAGDDLTSGGIDPADGAYAAAALEEHGVAMIDLSGGLGGSQPAGVDREGYFDYLGQEVKQNVRIPVMVTGGVRTPVAAERLLQSGAADLVGVGRALLADPDWAAKAVEAGRAQ
jgi:2,4-dienoyl-CoA reductase-like NADH-dependent reductase (Old Yellow Enzyme family)